MPPAEDNNKLSDTDWQRELNFLTAWCARIEQQLCRFENGTLPCDDDDDRVDENEDNHHRQRLLYQIRRETGNPNLNIFAAPYGSREQYWLLDAKTKAMYTVTEEFTSFFGERISVWRRVPITPKMLLQREISGNGLACTRE